MIASIKRQARTILSLVMREIITRFGREGLGFAWLVAEPLAFCFGVMVLWSFTKPAYEHGIRLAPFVMTAYMSLILIRHLIGYLAGALQGNMGLLYHRQIGPLHIFSARILLEFAGATIAYAIVYVFLLAVGQVNLPSNYLLLYFGWFLLAFISSGFALILTGLAMRFDVMERLIGLIGYLILPLSGVFTMVAWLPDGFRKVLLILPFVHPVEMMRSAVFGEFVKTYYDIPYALAFGAVFNIVGLLLISSARHLIETES
ncbi:ABC transporter permease [Brevundimonas huaxiensis]|uniref:ABC transporter permease n=1 Tax=Brevundimonas huaxiensis TaxID=2725493 RepID=UPI001629FEF8|nr:ABC transporter permease [Brevundimonas huaxiensis]